MFKLRSPAKINLFLKILNRRNDGYHEIASLFQAIDLFDQIHFTHADQDTFTCSNSKIPINDQNLILKAVALFRRKTGYLNKFSIHLEKNIPHEAGLGGGSSNAATTLWALNEISGKIATEKQLRIWGAELGSDVPFFLTSGTAYCTGRGEIINEVAISSIHKNFTLFKPNYGVSTASVYKNLCLENLYIRNPNDDLKHYIEGRSVFYNDLEDSAFSICPKLLDFKNYLNELNLKNLTMTGSGATFFCTGIYKPHYAYPDVWHCNVSSIQREQNLWY